MSLINDALKKAARQRAQEGADLSSLMPGSGSRSHGGGKKMGTQTMVFIGAAAVALIVVSAVITGILVTGKSPATPAASTATAKPPARVESQLPAPALVSVPRAAESNPAVIPPVDRPAAAPASVAVVAAPVTPQPRVVEPTAAPRAAPIVLQNRADTVQAILDRLHISGARASGAGSKALIDGHVYRLNDVIDKPTGLKLAKVDVDHLTFVDADGTAYEKSF